MSTSVPRPSSAWAGIFVSWPACARSEKFRLVLFSARPLRLDFHYTGDSAQVVTIATPGPVFVMFAAVAHLPPPFEQIAFAQAGGNTTFSTPWRATFENLTLRQAFNLIARNIAPRGRWALSGSREFRTIGFHIQRIHQSPSDPE